MTIWYFTTGISLQESSRCWRNTGLSLGFEQFDDWHSAMFEAAQQTGALRRWLQSKLAAIEGDHDPRSAAEHFVRDHFRTDCFSANKQRLLPAELSTLWALIDQEVGVGAGDELRFIGGKSNWEVAHILVAAARALLPGGANVPPPLGPYRVDPTDAAAFDESIAQLWQEEILPNTPHARFVLTGGYKATLLALAFRLADCRSIPTGVPTIYYTHEAPGSKLIPLGRGVSPAPEPGGSPPPRAPLTAGLRVR